MVKYIGSQRRIKTARASNGNKRVSIATPQIKARVINKKTNEIPGYRRNIQSAGKILADLRWHTEDERLKQEKGNDYARGRSVSTNKRIASPWIGGSGEVSRPSTVSRTSDRPNANNLNQEGGFRGTFLDPNWRAPAVTRAPVVASPSPVTSSRAPPPPPPQRRTSLVSRAPPPPPQQTQSNSRTRNKAKEAGYYSRLNSRGR